MKKRISISQEEEQSIEQFAEIIVNLLLKKEEELLAPSNLEEIDQD